MTRSSSSVTANTTNGAYRTSNPITRCDTRGCTEEAMVRCLRCGAPSCNMHVLGNSYCADCEMALSGREARAGWAAIGVAVATGASMMFASGLGNLPVTMTLGGCCTLLAVLAHTVGRAMARSHFRAGNRFSAEQRVLESAELSIAPQLGPRKRRGRKRRGAGSGGASPGATPTPPMWARTYGVG